MILNYITSFCPKFDSDEVNSKKRMSDLFLLLLSLFAIATASFVFLYEDMSDMVNNSNLLLQCIKQGKFLDFYTYSLENNSDSPFPANYDFPIYLIFAIWNLPFALKFHYEVNGFVYLWFKLLVVICIFVCSFLMYRIYRIFDEKDHFSRGSFALLMFTSPLVFLSEFIAGQYDCISMVLILAGLYAYLKDRDLLTVLFFCLAIPIKTFAIFLFLPLLAYKQKNVLKMLAGLIGVMIIPIFCKILFRNDPAYSFLTESQNRDATLRLTEAVIKISGVQIHIFIVLFLLICFFCYFRKYDRANVLWIAAVIYTSFILFVAIRSYWVFLAQPFLILLITTRPKLFKVNFLVYTIGDTCGAIFFLYNHWIYNTCRITRQLGMLKLKKLPMVVKYGCFRNFIDVHGWDVYMPLLRTIFICSFVLLLVINIIQPEKLKFSSEFPMRLIAWLRLAVVFGMVGLMVFVEFYPTKLPVVDTLVYSENSVRTYYRYPDENEVTAGTVEQITGKYYEADINAGSIVEQPFNVKKDRTISQISIQCYNLNATRGNRGRLKLEIIDAETESPMVDTIAGYSLIENKEVYTASVEKTQLPKGKYILRISSIPTIMSLPINIMYNANETDAKSARIDGKKKKHPICFCIN